MGAAIIYMVLGRPVSMPGFDYVSSKRPLASRGFWPGSGSSFGEDRQRLRRKRTTFCFVLAPEVDCNLSLLCTSDERPSKISPRMSMKLYLLLKIGFPLRHSSLGSLRRLSVVKPDDQFQPVALGNEPKLAARSGEMLRRTGGTPIPSGFAGCGSKGNRPCSGGHFENLPNPWQVLANQPEAASAALES